MKPRASLLAILLLPASCAEWSETTTPEAAPPQTGGQKANTPPPANNAEHSASGGAAAKPDPFAEAPAELGAEVPERPRQDAHLKSDHEGPWFLVTAREAGVFAEPKPDRQKKLAWARNGGKLAVLAPTIKNAQCTAGWYQLVGGGYVCGSQGTTEVEGRRARLTQKQPNLEAVLPYRYVRNTKHGTPLYGSIPSAEQMHEYEPYLRAAKDKPKGEQASPPPSASSDATTPAAPASTAPEASSSAAAPTGQGAPLSAGTEAAAGGPELSQAQVTELNNLPWWQKKDPTLHELTIEQLQAEGDGILNRRMVSGFYVAVDSVFKWNDRTWYKTTKGLIAPADRFADAPGPTFQGVELDTAENTLPLAWVFGARKDTPLYELGPKDALTVSGQAKRYELLRLSGRRQTIRGREYHELRDGRWAPARAIRVTRPGPPPLDLQRGERWVDINVTEQTLVVFEGTKAVYATLISTGKSHPKKEKDHSTPLGEWRIREKHITTKMDGDGTAAGDLPYSIEDVPYVMYYHKSYALHGAFWHNDFGNKRSHGCVNLAPLDAKWVFFFTDPPVPHGVHGVWPSESVPGSRVVAHE
jgi:hypothetical protein